MENYDIEIVGRGGWGPPNGNLLFVAGKFRPKKDEDVRREEEERKKRDEEGKKRVDERNKELAEQGKPLLPAYVPEKKPTFSERLINALQINRSAELFRFDFPNDPKSTYSRTTGEVTVVKTERTEVVKGETTKTTVETKTTVPAPEPKRPEPTPPIVKPPVEPSHPIAKPPVTPENPITKPQPTPHDDSVDFFVVLIVR